MEVAVLGASGRAYVQAHFDLQRRSAAMASVLQAACAHEAPVPRV